MPQPYLVVVHKIKELSGANLIGEVRIPSNLDDGVQMCFLLLLPFLLLICLLGLHHDTSAVENMLMLQAERQGSQQLHVCLLYFTCASLLPGSMHQNMPVV